MTLLTRIRQISLQKQNSILSATLVLAITFVISALLGFLRSRFLYARFLSCCAADLDAYNAAFRLPDLIFKLLVTGALSASFIPVFSTYLHKDKKIADQIASTVINLLLALFIVAALIVLIFTRPLSLLIAQGFTTDQIDLMVSLTRILLIAQIFFLLSNFLTAILHVHQTFIVPALAPIVYNLFIIASIFLLTPKYGIYGAAIGSIVGAFFHLAIQIPIIKRVGFHYQPVILPKLSGVREIIRLMIPRALSLGLSEFQNTVTLFFSSSLVAGSLSLLNLAMQIMYLPSRIFGTTIGQASLPILSKNIAKNELDRFRNTVQKTLLQSLFIAAPISVLFLVHRLSIVRLAFGAKQFPWSATLVTAQTLAYLAPAIIFQALIQILVRSFYALHNTKTPLHVSIISLLINIIINFYFVNFTSLGILGLAISISLSNFVNFIGLFTAFLKQIDGDFWANSLKSVSKISLSSLLMASLTWLSLRFLDTTLLNTTRTLQLLVLFSLSSLFGLFVYILSAHFFKLEQLADFTRHAQKLKRFLSN